MSAPAAAVRSFVAVNLPTAVRTRLERLQADLRQALPAEAVRWTLPEQIHLTLRFIGQVPESALPELEAALRRACQGAGPFSLRACGAGCFPDLGRPTIIWAGLDGDLAALRALQAAVASGTAPWGQREERAFHPHLTLGRLKRPDGRLAHALAAALEAARNADFGQWQVARVELMRSELLPTGPRYSLLARVDLASAGA